MTTTRLGGCDVEKCSRKPNAQGLRQMSFTMVGDALNLDHEDLSPIDKIVLVDMAWHANETDGIAWPSVSTMSRRCCTTDRSVQRSLKNLQKLGLIEKVTDLPASAKKRRRNSRSNPYRLLLADDSEGDTLSGSQDSEGDTLSGSQDSEGDTLSEGDTPSPSEGDTPSPIPRHTVTQTSNKPGNQSGKRGSPSRQVKRGSAEKPPSADFVVEPTPSSPPVAQELFADPIDVNKKSDVARVLNAWLMCRRRLTAETWQPSQNEINRAQHQCSKLLAEYGNDAQLLIDAFDRAHNGLFGNTVTNLTESDRRMNLSRAMGLLLPALKDEYRPAARLSKGEANAKRAAEYHNDPDRMHTLSTLTKAFRDPKAAAALDSATAQKELHQ